MWKWLVLVCSIVRKKISCSVWRFFISCTESRMKFFHSDQETGIGFQMLTVEVVEIKLDELYQQGPNHLVYRRKGTRKFWLTWKSNRYIRWEPKPSIILNKACRCICYSYLSLLSIKFLLLGQGYEINAWESSLLLCLIQNLIKCCFLTCT